jgi:flagellar M-ring protein FliF
MQQWKQLLASLSLRQKITIAAAVVLVGGSLIAFSSWRRESDFKPLYTGMNSEDAGAVVAKLKESGVEYRLSDDGSRVLVPSARLAEIRLQMAAAGLPKSGRIGFELFDKTNLGVSDFAEHINYRRALEGELERSIKAVGEVQQARVHLTFPKDSVFLESRLPAKASVLLTTPPGATLSRQNVLAIAHLVSSAVEGLDPEAVSIMDSRGNLLSRRRNPLNSDEPSDELLEYRQKIERDLLVKVNGTLEPLLGPEKFRAAISVECDFTSGEQSEETYDPERSVMTNSQKSEEITSTAGSGGLPGTASNLPRPPVRGVVSGAGLSRRTENISYQSSRTIRKLRLPQGSVKRLSASILLDQSVRWEGSAGAMRKVLVPPSQENLRVIRELVAGVIGLQPGRGDQIIVESLPFESTLNEQAPAPAVPAGKPESGVSLEKLVADRNLLMIAGAAVLVLAVGAAVFIFFMRKRKRRRARLRMAAALASAKENPAARAIAGSDAAPQLGGADGPAQIAADGTETSPARIEQLLVIVRETISQDPALGASVLRSWLQEGRR